MSSCLVTPGWAVSDYFALLGHLQQPPAMMISRLRTAFNTGDHDKIVQRAEFMFPPCEFLACMITGSYTPSGARSTGAPTTEFLQPPTTRAHLFDLRRTLIGGLAG